MDSWVCQLSISFIFAGQNQNLVFALNRRIFLPNTSCYLFEELYYDWRILILTLQKIS
jgi:hypothetical protein